MRASATRISFSTTIPTALVGSILAYLNISDLCSVSLVDKALLSLARCAVVWTPIYNKMFGFSKEELSLIFNEECSCSSSRLIDASYFNLCSLLSKCLCHTCGEKISEGWLIKENLKFYVPTSRAHLCKAVPRKLMLDLTKGSQLLEWDNHGTPCANLLCRGCSCDCDCKYEHCQHNGVGVGDEVGGIDILQCNSCHSWVHAEVISA
jgi:hypothetical protein